MGVRSCLIMVLCFAGINKSIAQLKIDKRHYIQLLKEGKYEVVLREANQVRGRIFGKCCLVDYFIAKALCMDKYYETARKEFTKILNAYKLTDKNRTFIQGELSACGGENSYSEEVIDDKTFNTLANLSLPTSYVSGKIGKIYDCAKGYKPIEQIREVPGEELSSRIFDLNQKKAALKKIASMVSALYKVDSSGNFIVVSPKAAHATSITVNNITHELQKVLNFYCSFYSLRPPDKLITVYLVPNSAALQSIAQKIHGIKIPAQNLGYSCVSDLSLLGISDLKSLGTLKHELFHLAVRTDVGDIPAWLDEGIACLYEESHWKNGSLVSDDKVWRTKVLENALFTFDLYCKVPDIEDLLNYSWPEFEATEYGNICKASINYAYAKHLCMYFERSDVLKKIVEAYKNRKDFDVDNMPQNAGDDTSKSRIYESNVELFQKTTGEPFFITEAKFDKWLKASYDISIFHPNPQNTGYQIGIESFQALKENIRKAQKLYYTTPNARLFAAIDHSKWLLKFESQEFDFAVRNALSKKNVNYPEGELYFPQEIFRRKVEDENKKLEEVIRFPY